MRNANKLTLILWMLFPLLATAQVPPPITRSVLTTNIPAFGSAGQALFRISVSPYLNWSNVVASGGLSISDSNNIINLASNYTYAVSNYAYTASNSLAGQIFTASNAVLNAASNYTFAVSNLVVASTNGQFIEKTGGVGTNTTIRQVNQTGPALTIGTNAGAVFSIMGVTNGPSQYLVQVGSGQLAAGSGGTNTFMVSTNGKVGVGSSPVVKFEVSVDGSIPDSSLYNVNDSFMLVNSGAGATMRFVTSEGLAGNGSALIGVKSRGTAQGPQIVQSGDGLFLLDGMGFDGVTRQNACAIRFDVDATPGANDMPGRITFQTTPDNSATLVDRMVIKNSGLVGIGTNSPFAGLHVITSTGSTNQYVRISGTTNNPTLETLDTNGVLTVKSNIFASGNPVGCYGSLMMNATNIVICAASAGVYTNVCGTGYTTAETNGFTGSLTDGSLTNLVAGRYRITVCASALGQNNQATEWELFTNGVACDLIGMKKTYDAAARLDDLSMTGIVNIPANCRLDFRVQDAGTGGSISIHRASITVGTP